VLPVPYVKREKNNEEQEKTKEMISNHQIQLRFIDLLSVMIIMKNLSFNNDKVNPFYPIAMLPIFAGLI
jgi:hypothetical protein